MRIDALVEDKSGSVLIYHVLKAILKEVNLDCPLGVYPHRGIGHLPSAAELLTPPKPNEMGLLSQLPAKLRAYNKVYGNRPGELLLILVMDADNREPGALFEHLQQVILRSSPAVATVVGVAIEELEAWLLGDPEALLKAYPEADRERLAAYQQDSVCGTWECLAEVLLGDRACDLVELGYPAVGRYKFRWAAAIAPGMQPAANQSPSFKRFYRRVRAYLKP